MADWAVRAGRAELDQIALKSDLILPRFCFRSEVIIGIEISRVRETAHTFQRSTDHQVPSLFIALKNLMQGKKLQRQVSRNVQEPIRFVRHLCEGGLTK